MALVDLHIFCFFSVGESNSQRHVRIVDEVASVERCCGTCVCILAGHRVDRGTWYDDIEVIGNSILVLSNHIDFIRYFLGNTLRNSYDKGVVCNIAGVEYGLLVVEVHLIYTT